MSEDLPKVSGIDTTGTVSIVKRCGDTMDIWAGRTGFILSSNGCEMVVDARDVDLAMDASPDLRDKLRKIFGVKDSDDQAKENARSAMAECERLRNELAWHEGRVMSLEAQCAELKKAGASTADYTRESEAQREEHRPASAELVEREVRAEMTARGLTQEVDMKGSSDGRRYLWIDGGCYGVEVTSVSKMRESIREVVGTVESCTVTAVQEQPKAYEPFEFLGVPR